MKRQKFKKILVLLSMLCLIIPLCVFAADKTNTVNKKTYYFVNSDGLTAIVRASHTLKETYAVSGSSRIYNERWWFVGIERPGVVAAPKVDIGSPVHAQGSTTERTFKWSTQPIITGGEFSDLVSIINRTSVTYSNKTPIKSVGYYQFTDNSFIPAITPVSPSVALGD